MSDSLRASAAKKKTVSRNRSSGRSDDSSEGASYSIHPQSGFLALLGGAATAMLSAMVTAFGLLINGSITLFVLGELTDANPDWIERKGVLQFALFTMPLAMLVAEWLIWDFVRGLLRRQPSDEDQWNSI